MGISSTVLHTYEVRCDQLDYHGRCGATHTYLPQRGDQSPIQKSHVIKDAETHGWLIKTNATCFCPKHAKQEK